MIAGMESQRTRDSVRDRRIKRVVELVPPATLLDELPLGDERAAAVVRGREEVAAVLDRDDDRLLVVAGPCSVHDPEAALDYAQSPRRRGGRPRRRPAGRDAGLLREAAHDRRLEGAHQRPPPRRLRRRQLRPADRPRAPARRPRRRPVGRLRVPRSDHPAVHRRHRRLGGDRRADEREPDAPPARLRALDADRVQEPNRRQRAGRGRRRPRRGRPARVRGHRRRGGPGDPLHDGKPATAT